MSDRRTELRRLADASIGPIAGVYLRPWMSAGDPIDSEVFIVGANAATPFPAAMVSRETYLEALVSGGTPLRSIYDTVRDGRGPSPTRQNSDRLAAILQASGMAGVLETNVWAFPTKSLAGLRRVDPGLVEASTRVLPDLISILRPRALIVHGTAATEGLARTLGMEIAPATSGPIRYDGDPTVWVIPSLSPPAANRWLPAGWPLLHAMSREISIP